MVTGKIIESGKETIETDEHTYRISYSVKFVSGVFRCIARLRYDYQSWRYDPIHKSSRRTSHEGDVQEELQEAIDSCKDAIDRTERAESLDLDVTVK
jgi:hypothetical protein